MTYGFRSCLRVLIGVIFCFSLTPNSAQSAEEYVARMAATTWEPFMFLEGDVQKGIDYEIARLLSEQMGFILTMRHCPFKRCLTEIERGGLDLQSGIAFNEQRAQFMTYLSTPYGEVSARFYVRKGEGYRLKSYDDLHKIRVGMVTASHYFEPFNSDDRIKKIAVPKEEMLFTLLEKGRVDAIIGTSPNLEYQIKKYRHKGKFEIAAYMPDNKIPLYFAISNKSALLTQLDRFNAVMLELKESGLLDDIHAKYR